jgi:hypothetical protein
VNDSFGSIEKKVSSCVRPEKDVKLMELVAMSEMPLPPSFLELPELRVVVLDRPAIERVFSELAFETTVLGVLVKEGKTERANGPEPSLGTAREVLLSAEATAVQIHYAHRGEEWWATLMMAQGAVRFVRVRRHTVPEE